VVADQGGGVMVVGSDIVVVVLDKPPRPPHLRGGEKGANPFRLSWRPLEGDSGVDHWSGCYRFTAFRHERELNWHEQDLRYT
jgi:hypothetical protein